MAVKTFADAIEAKFQRLQFTPDLLPADLVGTMIFTRRTPSSSRRRARSSPNIVLADEINRAPAKVQSALLEAMQERQVTIGDTTFPLPDPFSCSRRRTRSSRRETYPLPRRRWIASC